MARPRKPTKIKKLQGTAQPCRMNPDEPEPSNNLPVAPGYFDALQKANFDTLVQRMAVIGYASESYTEIISLAAAQQTTVDICEEMIKKHGFVYTTSNSFGDSIIKEHPYVAIRSDAWQKLRMCLVELGLTPASMSRVSVKKKTEEKKSKWAQ